MIDRRRYVPPVLCSVILPQCAVLCDAQGVMAQMTENSRKKWTNHPLQQYFAGITSERLP